MTVLIGFVTVLAAKCASVGLLQILRVTLFAAACTLLFLFVVGVALLYGGEFFEVIRFMDPVPEQMDISSEEYVMQLAAAKLALEETPLVTHVCHSTATAVISTPRA